MFTTQFLKINFILGLVGIMFISCRGDHSKEPPIVLIQNMLDQTSFREQSKNDFFKAMVWKNSNEGVAVGYEGSIIKTSDGGASWQVKRNGNDLSKQKIHFLNI